MNETNSNITNLNPTEWEQLHETEVRRHRKLNCLYYPVCLTYAAVRKWSGWTCRKCDEFEEAVRHKYHGSGKAKKEGEDGKD